MPFFQVRNAGRNPSAADDKLCEQYETKIAKDDDPDSSCRWEEAASIRRRVLPVLKKYADAPKVIVIGHGMIITIQFTLNSSVLQTVRKNELPFRKAKHQRSSGWQKTS